MRKLFSLLFLLSLFAACNKGSAEYTKEIEFYVLESYQFVTGKCQVNPSTAIIQNAPLISNNEILQYNKSRFEYRLSKAAIQKINALSPRSAFAVTVDKEIVFLGIYMPPTMSSTCEHSITMFALNNIAYMHLGYPGWIQTPTTAGIDDQRNNPSLLAALKAQGKLQ